ncbi:hypothetical protein HYW18_00110 [Candidatus Uhrbacteria bacterium]|nr:hypothetical protein [Candidatus Uhrbacteria bacterium]
MTMLKRRLFFSPVDIAYIRLGLWGNGVTEEEERLEVAPERQLAAIEEYRARRGLSWDDIDGLVVETGPGSPTALRTGIAIANTLGFALGIPLFDARSPMVARESLVPEYGREPNITIPKS